MVIPAHKELLASAAIQEQTDSVAIQAQAGSAGIRAQAVFRDLADIQVSVAGVEYLESVASVVTQVHQEFLVSVVTAEYLAIREQWERRASVVTQA